MKNYIQLMLLSLLVFSFSYSAEDEGWDSLYGQKWKQEGARECINEAQTEMGSEYVNYKTEIQEYCTCMMDIASEVYSTPADADWAAENNEEEFFAKMIENGVEDCLKFLMEALGNVDDPIEQKNEYRADLWNGSDGKKWKIDATQECVNEAQTEMGSEYVNYKTEIQEYCACLMDVASEVYPTPADADWAQDNNEEEFFSKIIARGVEDCLAIMMKMMEGLEQK